MIAEVLAAYGSEVAPHKASARNIGYNITNLLKWWGDKTVGDISPKSAGPTSRPRPSRQPARI
jgi:hypothetical protein